MNSIQVVKRQRFEGGVSVEAILVATQKQHAQAIKPYLSNFHYIPNHQQKISHYTV